jgi:hypothetical protein
LHSQKVLRIERPRDGGRARSPGPADHHSCGQTAARGVGDIHPQGAGGGDTHRRAGGRGVVAGHGGDGADGL